MREKTTYEIEEERFKRRVRMMEWHKGMSRGEQIERANTVTTI